MRPLLCLIPAVFILLSTTAAAQQQGIPEDLSMENYSLVDRFRLNLPGRATVTETTWKSLYDVVYPARVYSVEKGPNRDSITVVDYTNGEKLTADLRAKCQEGVRCTEGFQRDLRAAIDYATWRLSQKYAKLTYIGWDFQDFVEGRLVRFENADGTRATASIYMHENRLYIVESVIAPNEPDRPFVHQSLQFLDAEGNLVRYKSIYINGFVTPPRVEQEGNADFRKRVLGR